MYWVMFSGDPEEDDYRHKQSKYWDKLMVTLWAAVEVTEINGKTKQQTAPRETRTRDQKSEEETVQGVAKERATPARSAKHAGCSSKASARMARSASSSTRLGQARGHR